MCGCRRQCLSLHGMTGLWNIFMLMSTYWRATRLATKLTHVFTSLFHWVILWNKAQVERYITQLRERINWLTSGSRAPFGVLSEKRLAIFCVDELVYCRHTLDRVLLLVEFSGATLPFVSQLQNCLRLLLLEQLSHTAEFNIMRSGV